MILRGADIDFSNENSMVAIIGSREASYSECNRSYVLAKTLASYGITIVSGLAKGIDINAHRGAMEVESPNSLSLAILSTTVRERVYPNEFEEDVQFMIDEGGSVLHLYDKAAPWTKERFGPKQKRLAERSAVQALVSGSVYVVSDNPYIEGGTRWALNYAKHWGKPTFRVDSEGNTYPNPNFKVEKNLIWWRTELDYEEVKWDLVNKNYKLREG